MDRKIIIAGIVVIVGIGGILYLYMGGDNTNTNSNQNVKDPANIGIDEIKSKAIIAIDGVESYTSKTVQKSPISEDIVETKTHLKRGLEYNKIHSTNKISKKELITEAMYIGDKIYYRFSDMEDKGWMGPYENKLPERELGRIKQILQKMKFEDVKVDLINGKRCYDLTTKDKDKILSVVGDLSKDKYKGSVTVRSYELNICINADNFLPVMISHKIYYEVHDNTLKQVMKTFNISEMYTFTNITFDEYNKISNMEMPEGLSTT